MAITPLTKKRELYSDLGKEMVIHPVTGDVSRLTNEEAVKESIRNLVLTNRGERPFQPNLGCDVRSQLFENITQETVGNIKSLIQETIEAYEPRARLIGVDVGGKIDSNELKVTITFLTINSDRPTTVDIILNRVR